MPSTSGMDSARLINILGAATLDGTPFTAPVGPLMLKLDSALAGTPETGAATEISNSAGYTTGGKTMGASPFGTPTFTAPNAISPGNLNIVTWTNMPAVTVNDIEIWDSAGTPLRWWFGALTTPETTNLGDTLTFAANSIVPSMTG